MNCTIWSKFYSSHGLAWTTGFCIYLSFTFFPGPNLEILLCVLMDRSTSSSTRKTLKKPGRSASTSEGGLKSDSSPGHKERMHVQLDLESLQSTLQEVSSSVEGPVVQQDNVLARLSARFSRNMNKNKLQPSSSRRAVRIVRT
jgi:hypothetical protein